LIHSKYWKCDYYTSFCRVCKSNLSQKNTTKIHSCTAPADYCKHHAVSKWM